MLSIPLDYPDSYGHYWQRLERFARPRVVFCDGALNPPQAMPGLDFTRQTWIVEVVGVGAYGYSHFDTGHSQEVGERSSAAVHTSLPEYLEVFCHLNISSYLLQLVEYTLNTSCTKGERHDTS